MRRPGYNEAAVLIRTHGDPGDGVPRRASGYYAAQVFDLKRHHGAVFAVLRRIPQPPAAA
jgi:hypothetical protein